VNTWTLADIAALEDTRWPKRHRLETELAAWLERETRAAAARHRRIVRDRRRTHGTRVRRRAEVLLAGLPPEPARDVAERCAVLAGYDEGEEAGAPQLVGGVWRWGAA
jgi:hypothetical protein